MKRLLTLMLVLILAISCVSLWACDGDDEEDGGTVTQQTPADEPTVEEPTASEPTAAEPTVEEPTPDEPTVEEPTPTEPATVKPAKGLENFLSQAKKLDCYSYQQVVSGLGVPTATNNVWYKHGKLKMESDIQGMTSSTLVDLNEGKAYSSMMGQVMEIDITPGMGSTADQIEYIMDFNPTIKGTETIDGKECVIVEYAMDGQTERMWIWTDYGFPVKFVTETPKGKVTMVLQNIDLETCAEDSVFEMPQGGGGVQIPDIPGMP